MSAEQTPDIERVLAEHEYMLQMSKGAICLCGFVPTVDADSLATQQDYHRAHVAQALAPVLAAAVREAVVDYGRDLADLLEPYSGAALGSQPTRSEIAAFVRDRADRVAEPQHEAATSGKESEEA